MSDAIAFLRRAIEQGQGLDQADLVLKGGRIFDLVGGELVRSDVAICSDRIVGTLGEYRGRREIDVSGKVVVPGFIDAHCHVESSLLTPLDVDRRSARDRQCARADWITLLPRRRDADGDGPEGTALQLRSGDGARDLGR